jgi:hypothetical protein
MKSNLLTAALLMMGGYLVAQDTTKPDKAFTWNLFADIYYSYDFNQPGNHLKPSFLYNHNRHNEFNLNLALARASYNTEKVRANIGLMAGTYAQYNLAAEPELLRHIYEATAGVRISKNKDLWIDAGIMPSHIGYETAVSKDNWCLTRSMAAENTPYYESGAKMTYTSKNNKLAASALLLNGWQRIQRPEANNTPAFGTQLIIKPNPNTTLNWSTFIGNDKPDSVRKWRYFNNFYCIIQFNDKMGLTLGFDIGLEQESKGSSKFNTWYSPTIIFRITPVSNWSVAARGEYYSDENGVIIPVFTGSGFPVGFKTFGASLNIDNKISNDFWWRTELRILNSKDAIFLNQQDLTKKNLFLTTSFLISF